MITRVFDADTGIIFVTATGLWTRADVDEHYDRLREMLDGLRTGGRPVRVLSDLTGAVRQGPDLEAHIRQQMERTYQDGDRVALLTADLGEKAHVRMVLGKLDIAAFSSRLPAEMWLLLDEVHKGVA